MKKKKSLLKRFTIYFLWIFLLLTVLLNWIVYNHAYQFTHSDPALQGEHPQGQVYKMKNAGFWEKLGYIIWGISVPKSQNSVEPDYEYETLWIVGRDSMEGWLMETEEDSKGIVTLWHGYGASKAMRLPQAYWFLKQGYDCLLVDFPGHGGSSGTNITIGYKEADDVKLVNEYLKKEFPEKERILFGNSMGSAAILKAVSESDLGVKALIVECPFASLRHAVIKRFELMNMPTFLIPDLMIFWGGVQNGFWGHGHKIWKNAQKIDIPTLILYGAKDEKVGREEVEMIFKNLKSKNKSLEILECAGHNHLLDSCPEEWPEIVSEFLQSL